MFDDAEDVIYYCHILHVLCVSVHGHCHVRSRLTEVRGVLPSLFHAFSLDYFHRRIAHKGGRLAHAFVEGNSLFIVMGQYNCD